MSYDTEQGWISGLLSNAANKDGFQPDMALPVGVCGCTWTVVQMKLKMQ